MYEESDFRKVENEMTDARAAEILEPPETLVHRRELKGREPMMNGKCHFCGQRYIDERRPEPPIIRGAHLSDDESYAICDKCGATSGSWKFVAHGDGPKRYFNTYNCKCGQCITVKYRRAGATW